jgi:hypothetical protein
MGCFPGDIGGFPENLLEKGLRVRQQKVAGAWMQIAQIWI